MANVNVYPMNIWITKEYASYVIKHALLVVMDYQMDV